MYSRIIQKQIQESLFQNKIVILYGPRQVGKTTLAKEILKKNNHLQTAYYLCESPDVEDALTNKTAKQMKNFFGEKTELIVLDEAQSVPNIGRSLKLLIDTYPNLQIIVTGSSSFDLANALNEPLTGRYVDFFLYPLSVLELQTEFNEWETKNTLNKMLVTGLYPEVFVRGQGKNQQILNRITDSYLFEDILKLENVKSPSKLKKLLQALAFQVGNEVSLNELGNLVDLDKNTVNRYLDILQKAFIIVQLPAFSRNMRKEISKNNKIYFYDLGIRNSLIQNFNPLELRNDLGALWENFLIIERMKRNEYQQISSNNYFWRNYSQQEIDYIEEFGGVLNCYEFKWNDRKKAKLPNSFAAAYPNHTFQVINQDNWLEFVA